MNYEWYETATRVVITIFQQNLENESYQIVLNPRKLICGPYVIDLYKKVRSYDLIYHSHKLEIFLDKDKAERWGFLSQPKDFLQHKFDIGEVKDEIEDVPAETLEKMMLNIYKNSNGEGKRAMNKSFYESEGTVLSTVWTDVSRDKVNKIKRGKRIEDEEPLKTVGVKYGSKTELKRPDSEELRCLSDMKESSHIKEDVINQEKGVCSTITQHKSAGNEKEFILRDIGKGNQ